MQSTENRAVAADVIAQMLTATWDAIDVNELADVLKIELGEALAVMYEMGTASVAIYWDDVEATTAQPDPLSAVRVGDDDPYDCEDDGDCCSAFRNYLCTRQVGHPGQHIAGDGYEVLEVWND